VMADVNRIAMGFDHGFGRAQRRSSDRHFYGKG